MTCFANANSDVEVMKCSVRPLLVSNAVSRQLKQPTALSLSVPRVNHMFISRILRQKTSYVLSVHFGCQVVPKHCSQR